MRTGKRPGEGHWIRKKGGGWLIAVPPEIRRLLGVTHRKQLYWHPVVKGEAILAARGERATGRPPTRQLARELAAAHVEIEAIRHRDELRDRSMYAEGFAHGYMQARARLESPGGASAERGRRRALWRWAFPDAASAEDPKQVAPRPAPAKPRWNSRTRRAKRDEKLARGAVETYHLPEPSAPGEAVAPALTGEEPETPERGSEALPHASE